jgi:hypothetical protein
MSELDDARFFGNTERVFVIDRGENAPTPPTPRFFVRPGVVVVGGNQVLFRNFTRYTVTIRAPFLSSASFTLAARGSAGDRKTLALAGGAPAGFNEYDVSVDVSGKTEDAVGDSRPGAIIDR